MRVNLRGFVADSACGGPCGTAHATPAGPGISGRVISRTTVDGTGHTRREITLPPGQVTGRHHHHGPLFHVLLHGSPFSEEAPDPGCSFERAPCRGPARRAAPRS
ncbi:hypothetical protein [Streptomyces sp. NPDC057438]|uniref:hypothetical protein n=1 Tax=Streptomyces sp. NPDC057438 TaxID=3346133 RepID=UPI0036BBDDAF